MRKIIVLVLLSLPLLSNTNLHKYYVSVSVMHYNSKEQSLQIISRIFIDDLEQVLNDRYDYVGHLATKKEKQNSQYYIEKYVKAKMRFWKEGKELDLEYIGREYEDDMIKVYLELPNTQADILQKLSLRNEVLFDMFPEQQNIMHLKVGNRRKSYIFTRESDKALLKL
ncbi:MAG: hypothetical protein OIF50_06920 [Flavobacteriaceae bacterium]|nr:hypothetical protein [Flavobacteriaceae bacterium]